MSYLKLIHLSDLHISTESKPEVWQFNKIIGAIAEHYSGVPVLITGDITDSATKPQMKLARKYIEKLAKTNLVLCVPGNHDYAAVGNFHRWEAPAQWTNTLGRPFGPHTKDYKWMTAEAEPMGTEGIGVYETDSCVFIGVDSGDPTDKVRMARGIITKQLSVALKYTLDKYQDKIRIVLMHHHPFTDALFLELRGSGKLMNALNNNCELLLFGHKHNIGVWWNKEGIPLILSSHKSTRGVSGNELFISIIEIVNDAGELDFLHSLRAV